MFLPSSPCIPSALLKRLERHYQYIAQLQMSKMDCVEMMERTKTVYSQLFCCMNTAQIFGVSFILLPSLCKSAQCPSLLLSSFSRKFWNTVAEVDRMVNVSQACSADLLSLPHALKYTENHLAFKRCGSLWTLSRLKLISFEVYLCVLCRWKDDRVCCCEKNRPAMLCPVEVDFCVLYV